MPELPRTLFLKDLRMRDVRGFEDVDLSFLDEDGRARRLTVLVGHNGTGKSTLLRALALALSPEKEAAALAGRLEGPFVHLDEDGRPGRRAEIELTLVDPDDPETVYRVETVIENEDSEEETLTRTTEPDPFPWSAVFAAGYGSARGFGRQSGNPPSAFRRLDAVAGLFDDQARLIDPEGALKTLKLDSLDGSDDEADRVERFERVVDHLRELLELERADESGDEEAPITVSARAGVRVTGPWGTLPFHALGDGYRAVAGWFLDLCHRAFVAGRLPTSGYPRGVVLIDGIDDHLHPARQKKLVPTLRRLFPGLQFVVIAHSPMAIVNCRDHELFAGRLEHHTTYLQPLAAPRRRMADAILRGEWFGLRSTLDDESEQLLLDFQEAVRNREPKEVIRERRAAVEQRIGRLFESPLEPMALEIAEEVRRQADDSRRASRDAGLGRRRGGSPIQPADLGTRRTRSLDPSDPREIFETAELDPEVSAPGAPTADDSGVFEVPESFDPGLGLDAFELELENPRGDVLEAARRLRNRIRSRKFSSLGSAKEDEP